MPIDQDRYNQLISNGIPESAARLLSNSDYTGEARVANFHLTAEDLLNIVAAPPLLIPAQGVGKAIVPIYAFGEYKYAGTRYLNGNISLSVEGSSGGSLMTSGFAFDALGSTSAIALPFSGDSAGLDLANKGLVAYGGDGSSGAWTPLGPIVDSEVVEGGADYEVGDAGLINSMTGEWTAQYEVDTVDGGGAVLTYHLTNPGGPAYSPTYALELPTIVNTGVGDGFTVHVLEIPPPAGDFYLKVRYLVEILH